MMIKEVQRVLKTGGIYLVVSYGNPMSRMMHFVGLFQQKRAHLGFEIECLVLKSAKTIRHELEPKESEHFCYICVKRHDADRLAQENWERVMEEILKEETEDHYIEDELE